MLFLAVFAGFLAENLREHIKDKQRVHEYMESVLSDLQSDLEMYQSGRDFNLLHLRMIDTLISSLSENRVTNHDYYMARQLTMGSAITSPNTKTFDQMKSSGILRLIHKHFIADSISSYYQWTGKFNYWSDLQKQRISDVIDVNEKIFDGTAFFKVLKQLEEGSVPDVAGMNFKLTATGAPAINSVIMKYQYYYGMLILMNQRMALASEEAKRLLLLIEDEYQLK
jgi:hypothetical protein